jgi:hypothetical protein
MLETGSIEECDGTDTDCDRIDDTADPDALSDCNVGRAPNAPAATACNPASGGCRCGAGDACSEGEACCGGSCVDVLTSLSDCGGCGVTCSTACVDGVCLAVIPPDGGMCTAETCGDGDEDCDGNPDTSDPDALDWCNRERGAGNPVANACAATGCRCGSEPACAGTDTCCDATCVDTDTNPFHCGECGNACEGLCTEGACACVPVAEMCNGEDDDCDGVPDTTDPDALGSCNLGRPENMPVANTCGGNDGCFCGGLPPCTGDNIACCEGACVDTSTDDNNCGGCGTVCDGGLTCTASTCS